MNWCNQYGLGLAQDWSEAAVEKSPEVNPSIYRNLIDDESGN